ncbi:MAG: ChbG/HpnK family deacetylase [Dissulfurispiraceae bacterium]
MVPDMTFTGKPCLAVVADDMGKSASVNRAIAEAHDKGFLTAASIMAGGEAFDDAVQTVLERSRLSAGLHVTLCVYETRPSSTDRGRSGRAVRAPGERGHQYPSCGRPSSSPYAPAYF